MPPNSQYLESLDCNGVKEIICGINVSRLAAFRETTTSVVDALSLYQLNARLAGLLLETVGGFEIVLRNATAALIIDHFQRDDWYRARVITQKLDVHRRKNIRDARKRLQDRGRKVDSGRIVSELTFHFWVALHERKYREQFWIRFLRKIWPDGEDVRKLHKDLLKIRDLGNRIAHHEPVFVPRWRTCSALVLRRLEQLSPRQHAWLSDRMCPDLADVSDRCRKSGCPGPPQIQTCALTHPAPALGVDGKALGRPRVTDGGFWPVEADEAIQC